MNDIRGLLEEQYSKCMEELASSEIVIENISSKILIENLNFILEKSEAAKGVLTVILTSIVYKHFNKAQDIRNHQASLPDGYSGRSFDTKFITPFLKEKKFPAMAESGWLTRSLEHNSPYNKNYNGKIRPDELKRAFLAVIEEIQNDKENKSILRYIFQYLILQRNKKNIQLARPIGMTINDLVFILGAHFSSKYNAEGASRLPTLAIYAVYQCLIKELKRFDDKKLLPLESHTSADLQSGRIGDIDIVDKNGQKFEAVEIKYGIEITKQLISNVHNKFQVTPVNRYYVLSTAGIKEDEKQLIEAEIMRIKNIHGCQVVANGILSTLKYYLRLINNTFDFVDNYVKLLEEDLSIKYEHKLKWNEIINSYIK
jgi:DNA (cytosine-5)-methyltransferase 1